jgi:hypothetical protein
MNDVHKYVISASEKKRNQELQNDTYSMMVDGGCELPRQRPIFLSVPFLAKWGGKDIL